MRTRLSSQKKRSSYLQQATTVGVAKRCWCVWMPAVVLALLLWFSPLLAGVAAAHALLVRSDPPANAVLTAPPGEVRLWFSEAVTPGLSTAVVVDPGNHEVDNHDAHVNPGNPQEIDVTLPPLKPGQYVVAWVTVSAADGHRVGGSFIFAIAAPNGVVPKATTLPTGHFPGAAGSASATFTPDPPTLLSIFAVWGVLLAALLLAGGLFWEVVILVPAMRRAAELRGVLMLASRRFRPLIIWSLVVVLVGDLLFFAAQVISDAGGILAGLIDRPLLNALLLSKFGIFWTGRQLVAVVMLLFLLGWDRWTSAAGLEQANQVGTEGRPGSRFAGDAWHRRMPEAQQTPPQGEGLPLARGHAGDTQSFVAHALSSAVPTPAALAAASEQASELALPTGPGAAAPGQPVVERLILWRDTAMLALAGLLLLMLALSGHAAAVTGSLGRYAVPVDWLHLAGAAIWLGGMFYIALVLLPVLPPPGDTAAHARPLLALLPRFAPWALGSVLIVILSGIFNTDAHIFYLVQMVTTPYGQTLTAKILLAATMVGISFWHAFRLRPRLRRALAQGDGPASARLLRRMLRLLHIEPALGVGVVLCVALLGPLAGTLALPQSSYLTPPPGGHAGPVTESAVANQIRITLHVAPATFGNNTITVTLRDPSGAPIDGGTVFIETNMLDMDMGTQTFVLKDTGQGIYTGEGQITMAGHWEYTVVVRTRANPNQLTRARFDFTAY